MGTCLLIIDPQIDFAEGGSLAVKGATADAKRLNEWIKREMHQIDDITVSLDSHDKYHIGHKRFWVDKHGNHPKAYTEITNRDVRRGKWEADQSEDQERA